MSFSHALNESLQVVVSHRIQQYRQLIAHDIGANNPHYMCVLDACKVDNFLDRLSLSQVSPTSNRFPRQ